MILNDPKVSKELLFNLRFERGGTVEIEKAKIPNMRLRWEDLNVFKDESTTVPDKYKERCEQYFEYFNSIILLISDLCLDRNQDAINFLEKEYPFDLCYEIINNGSANDFIDDRKNYGLKVRNAFTRLMITLWIDRSENIKIILPNRIRIWNKLQFAQNINQVLDYERYDHLKQFVTDYFKEILTSNKKQQYFFMKAYEKYCDDNQLTKSVIDLFE